MVSPKVRNENSDIVKRRRRQPVQTDNSVGKRVIELLGDRDFGWLSGKTGIPASTLSDYVQRGISRADNAVKIARALDTTVEAKVTLINVQGDFASWRATRATGDFDLRSFELRATPVQPVTGLRPGMSALLAHGL